MRVWRGVRAWWPGRAGTWGVVVDAVIQLRMVFTMSAHSQIGLDPHRASALLALEVADSIVDITHAGGLDLDGEDGDVVADDELLLVGPVARQLRRAEALGLGAGAEHRIRSCPWEPDGPRAPAGFQSEGGP